MLDLVNMDKAIIKIFLMVMILLMQILPHHSSSSIFVKIISVVTDYSYTAALPLTCTSALLKGFIQFFKEHIFSLNVLYLGLLLLPSLHLLLLLSSSSSVLVFSSSPNSSTIACLLKIFPNQLTMPMDRACD